MAASNRAKLITKLHAELKKKYTLPPSQPSRPLLEHLLYACLLQDAPYDLADEGLAKCEQEFFDWNEIRVTTVTELTQVLSGMPEPEKTARRLKEILQAVFEEFYAFDLDHLKKENLGKAVAKFEAMPPMTPFVLSYTIQHGLGGHAIPVDYASMVIMLSTGIANQSEAASGKIPGLERAIPKNKGTEFAALLHQAGVALLLDHNDKTARSLLDSISKGASDVYDEWEASKKAAIRRVKKRRREEKVAEVADAERKAEEARQLREAKMAKANKKSAAKSASVEMSAQEAAAKETAKAEAAKAKAAAAKKSSKSSTGKTAKKSAKAAPAKKAASKTETPAASEAKKKTTPSKKSTKAATSKTPSTKSASPDSDSTSKSKATKSATKKSPNRKLSKRKPR